MKTITRVHRNGAKNIAPTQTKTPKAKSKLGPEFRLPKDALHHVCLATVDRENQELLHKIPLDENEFASLWQRAVGVFMKMPAKLRNQMTPGHVFAGWLRQILRSGPILNEFESAKAQSHALHILLMDAMGSQKNGKYGEEIQFGISELMIQTHARMDKVYAAFQKQAAEVAS